MIGVLACSARPLPAQLLVPGTGQRVVKVGDDFEEPKWNYVFNNPKSSDEQDKQQRLPAGRSANGRWYEGVMRGHPDVIRRVPTPEGGIEGSEGSLLMVSRQTGIPGYYSRTMQQDDLIVDVQSRLGYSIPVSWSPNVVVRVYLPPFEEWERRNGPSFGFRAACDTHRMKPNKKTKSRWGGGGGSSWQQDTYWPGTVHPVSSRRRQELDPLLILRQRVAFFSGGEAALRRQRKLVERCELRRFLGVPRRLQRRRAQQAADFIGAKWRRRSRHPFSSTLLRLRFRRMVAPLSAGLQAQDQMTAAPRREVTPS